MATDQPTKICAHCKIEQPTAAFGNSARNKDGLSSWCKACKKIDSAADFQKNKTKRLAKHREWMQRNPGAHNDYVKAYQARNPEKTKANNKKQNAKRDPAKHRERSKRDYDKRRKPKPVRETKAGHKFCSKCKIEKPVTKFGVQQKNKDGLREQCRSCRKAIAAEWYVLNREFAKARNDKWAKENKEALDEYHRRYRKENKERINKAVSAWRKRNPEKSYAYTRKWTQAHPDLTALFARHYRARKSRAEGTHTLEDIAEIRRLQRDQCAMPNCRKKLNGKGHVDHIRALVNGGTNDRRNIQLLCQPCNNRKHAKDEFDFARENGLLL